MKWPFSTLGNVLVVKTKAITKPKHPYELSNKKRGRGRGTNYLEI
jgi:hypothetical protein